MRIGVVMASLIALLLTNANAWNKTVSAESRNELATVSILPAKTSFKVGEPVAVTVLLEAGEEGVYIEKWWAGAGGAIPGFYVWLETPDAKRVQACEPIADGMPNEEPDPRTILERNFIFLGQGQVVGWSTTITCPPHKRGRYLIQARYSPDKPLSQRVASLSEVRGRVIRSELDARPMEILIR